MQNPHDDAAQGEVLVLLPTYNERATLPGTVAGLLHHLPAAHLLIIDDGSPDGTGRLADELAADPRVNVHHRSGKLGLGTAYSWGFQAAQDRGYRYVVEMDSDGSHLPAELPALLAAAEAGAGLVIGARWVPGGRIVNWPWYRRWISRTGTSVARIALRSSLRDLTSGFRVLDTRWVQRLELGALDSQGYAFQVETAWSLERLGCPITEVPITFVERTEGHSKMSVGIVWEALGGVLRWGWRLRFPHRDR
ncbi:Dolichol-phosphate mannosyltransferase in lipid-linked oligosaccharide synthesis cluster [Leucobacter sp. 7(1)]|uniref:polyprenol monophosphomannose synthase n=1 Tax=Leucobacter sp. 7(1) TaxID=1255613 RepID=UPI00097E9F8E|nr:polyprenol monophosphomannose synthase [Leucobacter sp. 7(1)]SJN08247.1 Dolichol-phosphate mannosyltransferase in lipid-linked oligosaccharide synthesis cluster [Leucobacter sp. 7(1)]